MIIWIEHISMNFSKPLGFHFFPRTFPGLEIIIFEIPRFFQVFHDRSLKKQSSSSLKKPHEGDMLSPHGVPTPLMSRPPLLLTLQTVDKLAEFFSSNLSFPFHDVLCRKETRGTPQQEKHAPVGEYTQDLIAYNICWILFCAILNRGVHLVGSLKLIPANREVVCLIREALWNKYERCHISHLMKKVILPHVLSVCRWHKRWEDWALLQYNSNWKKALADCREGGGWVGWGGGEFMQIKTSPCLLS